MMNASNVFRIVDFLLLFIFLPAIVAVYNPGLPMLMYR